MKKFMIAHIEKVNNALQYRAPSHVIPWPGDFPEPDPPYEWRDCARIDAQNMGLDLKDSDLLDVKSYLEFRGRTDGLLECDRLRNCSDFSFQLPDHSVVYLYYDGTPLIVCWEEDWTEADVIVRKNKRSTE